MKTRKSTTPLLSALTASMLCASLVATVSAHSIYQKYDTEGWGQPIISVLMQGLSHRGAAENGIYQNADGSFLPANGQSITGEMPDALSGQTASVVSGNIADQQIENSATVPVGQQGVNTSNGVGSQQGTTSSTPDGSGSQPGAVPTAAGVSGNQQDMDSTAGSGSGNQQDLNSTANGGSGNQQGLNSTANGSSGNQQGSNPTANNGSGNQQVANPAPGRGLGNGVPGQQSPSNGSAALEELTQYDFTDVTQDYFDDALLIGDSRATGVALYSGWDNLTYYAENGMTIYNMFQSKTAKVNGQSLSIEEALQAQSFGKIYLEIGINEMGTGTVDSFMKAYEDAVAHLQELQPEAIIYVCGIMYVKQSKSESDPIFNNPNIQERNDRIAQLADGKNIFYLDINEIVTDETGNLNPDYTWDEVHLLGKYDSLWLDYFCSHGIVKEEI